MQSGFAHKMSELRKKKGVSQRAAATDLKISQALLSHYENGAREPGLEFVCRACDYYGVSADFLLGRISEQGSVSIAPETLVLLRELSKLGDRTKSLLEDLDA